MKGCRWEDVVLHLENKILPVFCFVFVLFFFNLEENRGCLFMAPSMEPGAISFISFYK